MEREFNADKKFNDYMVKLESYSSGLVVSDKGEFLKMLAFYEVVILPYIGEVVDMLGNAMIGKK